MSSPFYITTLVAVPIPDSFKQAKVNTIRDQLSPTPVSVKAATFEAIANSFPQDTFDEDQRAGMFLIAQWRGNQPITAPDALLCNAAGLDVTQARIVKY